MTTPETHWWRISRQTRKLDAEDMTGSGAKTHGGRWNKPAKAVTYTSTSISLAILETLAHLAGVVAIRNSFLVKCTVPDEIWSRRQQVSSDALLPSWRAQPAGSKSVRFGDAWLISNTNALMLIPSVIVPEEYNALVNPAHPDRADFGYGGTSADLRSTSKNNVVRASKGNRFCGQTFNPAKAPDIPR
ncbi:RES family NAD+ phosphorylase [Massilia sp. TWR1-2-2]|uniref:RES family NAD+ phosphorylase n=1 Tax=Massilia sp. TWR1-2-2 TaxID=2804584 RepID=UPI003CEEBACA